ncbi:MAG: HD domain-containing protein [Chlorobi bacterium]|nr:HD domain-containing protein [Chlorobiota bacterium]
MKTITTDLVKEAEDFVHNLLKKELSCDYVFHNIDHTRYVAEKAGLIGKNSGLSEAELNIVVFSAWFHDVGYIKGYENHEKRSADMAEEFLSSKDIGPDIIDTVKSCILATRMPQLPKNLLSQVLCDADMAHMADDNYFDWFKRSRKEWNNTKDNKVNKVKYLEMSKEFFENHNYFTEYAQKELLPGKEKNLKLLDEKLNSEKSKKDKKKKKSKKYSRGVESMFRNTARMQINLSAIADKKSNILISVNTIIISIATTVLVSRFEETPNIILPTLVFLFFSLATIVLAILSTRPHVSSGTFTREDLKNSKVNLLFFGNFYNMDLEEYEWALNELMKNEDRLYSAMIHDQHSLGKVLAKKYKLLRLAYNTFMFGIITSVLSFIIAFMNV